MGKSTLIVDNNKIFIRFLEDVLPKHYAAFDFIFAESADSARQKIENLSDLYCLVTDYRLGPGQPDGIQFAEEVRNRFPNVKIILISSSMDDSLRAKARQHEIYHCASKFHGLYEWIKFIEL